MNDAWITTAFGKRIHPLNPNPDDILLCDIMWALSMKCRFGGHCKEFYSVAQHSCLMAGESHIRSVQRWALLHDAAEAYLPDVPRPIKSHIPGFRAMEDLLMSVIANKYRLELEPTAVIREMDLRMLKTEMDQLMTAGCHQAELQTVISYPYMTIIPMTPKEAYCRMYGMADVLFPELREERKLIGGIV